MAVAYDTASATQTISNVSTIPTINHTASGSDRYVRFSAGWAKLGTATLTATYGGNAMTAVGEAVAAASWGSGVTGRAKIFGYIAPSTSSEAVVGTFTSAGTYGACGVVSYTGVDQTTPDGAAVSATGFSNAPSVTVTDATTGDMVSDALATEGGASLTAGQTQRFSANSSGYRGAGQDAAGSGSVAMGWSLPSSVNWAQVAAAIFQASGGPSAATITAATGAATSSTLAGSSIAAAAITPAAGAATASTLASANAIAITAPVTGRIYQQVSGVATITVTGTYIGGVTAIEARLVEHGTSTPVTGFDWTTVVGSPSGGTYTFDFDDVPTGSGWYQVQVRDTVDGAISDVGGKVGVGELIACAGQSNMGRFFNPGSDTVNDLVRCTGNMFTGWETSSGSGPTQLGGVLASAFGCPIGFVNTHIDGTSIASWNGSSSYTAAMAIFGPISTTYCALVFIQGEVDWNGTTYADYLSRLASTMDSHFRVDFGNANLPVVLVANGRYPASPGATSTYSQVKQAQYDYAAGNSDTYLVDRIDAELSVDGLHLAQAGSAKVGMRAAQAIKVAYGLASEYQGPIVDYIKQVSATVYDAYLTHNSGADISPSTGITGFVAIDPDDGDASLTIDTVDRQGAAIIRITLSSTPVGLPEFSYASGPIPDVSDMARDDSTLALPLGWVESMVAIEATTSAAITQADGVSTTSTLASTSTAAASITQADGAATTSTMAASAVSVAAFSAATGAATAETLTGAGLTAGASGITPAAGAATTYALAGSSTAAAAITPATGVATASTVAGAATASAAITPATGAATASTIATGSSTIVAASMVPAAGAATASTFAASAVAASVAIAAAGASSAQALAGSAQAVAAIVAAAGVATTSALVDVNAVVTLSEWWRYEIPAQDMRYSVAPQSLTFTIER